jgi:hypothetical protein
MASDYEDLPEWEALLDKAHVCIATGMQPSEYDALTDAEREAFVIVVNESRS